MGLFYIYIYIIIQILLRQTLFIVTFRTQINFSVSLMEESSQHISSNLKQNHEYTRKYFWRLLSMKNHIVVRNDQIPHKIFLIARNCSYWDGPKRYCTVKLKGMISYISTFLNSLKHDGILYLSLIHIWRCRRYAVCRSRWSPYH